MACSGQARLVPMFMSTQVKRPFKRLAAVSARDRTLTFSKDSFSNMRSQVKETAPPKAAQCAVPTFDVRTCISFSARCAPCNASGAAPCRAFRTSIGGICKQFNKFSKFNLQLQKGRE